MEEWSAEQMSDQETRANEAVKAVAAGGAQMGKGGAASGGPSCY